jgi:dihydrolipoamide dehydrogenase
MEFPVQQERQVDVAIIGCGSAGLYALGQVRSSGKSVVMIDGGELGTTCARIGCMPSKAAIQIAEDFHRRGIFPRYGLEGGEHLRLDTAEAMEHVRDLRDNFVDRVLSNSSDNFPEGMLIEQYAHFVGPDVLETEDGQRIRAKAIVIATGSRPVIPTAWEAFREHIITTDEFFELEALPASAAVIGLGVIGLEIGHTMARMGVEVTGIDLAQRIGGISDPEVNKQAVDIMNKEMPLWLGAGAELQAADDGRILVTAGERSVVVDKVFASLGRTPNLERLNLEAAGAPLDARGMPVFDRNTMQIGDLPIYIAGDADGERPLLHEAGDEGRIAGYNAATGENRAFRRKTPLNIVFSDPNIVQTGLRYEELDLDSAVIGEMPIAPVGRALIMGKNRGLIRVYADKASGRLLGAEMIAVRGEHLGHLLAWCIQKEMTVGELLQMPFYHPVMEEALQAALNNLYAKVDAKNPGPITELQVL